MCKGTYRVLCAYSLKEATVTNKDQYQMHMLCYVHRVDIKLLVLHSLT